MWVIMSLCAADEKSEKSEKTLNGEEKTDSGVETHNSEGNADEEDPLGPNCYYDKSKSFFDNISCDDTRWDLSSLRCALRASISVHKLSIWYRFIWKYFGFMFISCIRTVFHILYIREEFDFGRSIGVSNRHRCATLVTWPHYNV